MIVEDYERQTAGPSPPVTAFRDAFLRCLPDGARLADLGCGPGRDLHHFRSRGHSPVGVDASRGMVRRARERGLATVVRDLRRPPLKGAVF
ncbi:MAG: class I SAM-dependent methyltransferase [Actinomycetota bacterium]|nr:class I SAM-dependent methyltransferase [Actinomycetota bacterium]